MSYVNSDLITWSKTFSCGIRLIDDQHKGLVDLVNEMFNHVSGNEAQEREYFNKIILEAVNYIKVHFATEEKIMKTTGFSGYSEHKLAHENFIVTVVETINDFKYRRHVSLLSFTKFLKNWILSHIAVMDKQYFEYLRKMATRKADGKLSITSADVRFVNHMQNVNAPRYIRQGA